MNRITYLREHQNWIKKDLRDKSNAFFGENIEFVYKERIPDLPTGWWIIGWKPSDPRGNKSDWGILRHQSLNIRVHVSRNLLALVSWHRLRPLLLLFKKSSRIWHQLWILIIFFRIKLKRGNSRKITKVLLVLHRKIFCHLWSWLFGKRQEEELNFLGRMQKGQISIIKYRSIKMSTAFVYSKQVHPL